MAVETHPSFDKDDQAILSTLNPELEAGDDPVADGAPASDPAAAAAPASATAQAPAPAPVSAPAPVAADASAPAPADPAAAAPAMPPAPAPQGDPRGALRASRRAERQAREEADRLRQELEDLKAGKSSVETEVTDEELRDLEENFPLQAKMVHQTRELERRIAAAAPAAPAVDEFEPPSYTPAVQDVIDSVPELQAWQYDKASQDKFQRAVQYDTALNADPDWKGRTPAERFTEAVRRTNAAVGGTPSASPAAPAAPRTDPAAALANAQVEGPKGISDFRGGGPANAPAIDYSRMSDEAIMASLPAS